MRHCLRNQQREIQNKGAGDPTVTPHDPSACQKADLLCLPLDLTDFGVQITGTRTMAIVFAQQCSLHQPLTQSSPAPLRFLHPYYISLSSNLVHFQYSPSFQVKCCLQFFFPLKHTNLF